MKVAFYMTTILEYYGGMEKWIIDTSLELSKRYPNLEITIVTRDNQFTEKLNKVLAFFRGYKFDRKSLYKESYQNIIQKLGSMQYIKTSSFSEARQILKGFDVVYSKNEILEALIFKYFIGYKNIKYLIFGCHTALYYPFGKRIHNFLYTSHIYSFLTSGVKIFHVLNSTDAEIIKKLGRSFMQIPNPIGIAGSENNLIKYMFPFKISQEFYNIARIGRLTNQKGIERLQQIIENLSKKHYHNTLIHIVGDGEKRKIIEDLVNNYPFVKYYGHIENKYIPSFLSKMDLLLHTSLGESFGLTIVEANMQNVPVLAFNIPGPKDIIENGENGFLVGDVDVFCEKIEDFIVGKIKIINSKKYLLKVLNDDIIYKKLYSLITRKND